jgi:hypothetical protein
MSPRTEDELEAIAQLANEFLGLIYRSGCNRQTAIDTLEAAFGHLLTECLSGHDELEWYLGVISDRIHGQIQYNGFGGRFFLDLGAPSRDRRERPFSATGSAVLS